MDHNSCVCPVIASFCRLVATFRACRFTDASFELTIDMHRLAEQLELSFRNRMLALSSRHPRRYQADCFAPSVCYSTGCHRLQYFFAKTFKRSSALDCI